MTNSSAIKRRPRRRKSAIARWEGLFYVLPALILVAVFFLIPLGMTVWMSFHKWPLIGVPRFIGLQNYQRLLGDHAFWASMWFTVKYTVAATIGLLSIGLGARLSCQASTWTEA